MNKVFNINLGGYPFTIDEDAFEHLNRYLRTIDQHFRDSEGHEEIINDIEARMAELFQDRLVVHQKSLVRKQLKRNLYQKKRLTNQNVRHDLLIRLESVCLETQKMKS